MNLIAYNNSSLKEISELEKKINIQFPKDYKEFLINFNGGDVEDGYFYVRDLNQFMLMGNFFGINISEGFADINKINSEYGEDIPKKSILIGTDAGNSFILLVCDGENDGVWFYDDADFYPQSSDELNTYFICETFTEFMEMLETSVPPEE